MSEIFSTFGVEWEVLLVQAVNFGLLLAGLTYFLYKPVGRMLEARRQKVAQGVKDAEEAERVRKEVEGSRARKLAEAGSEADKVVAEARAAAGQKEREIVGRAEDTAAVLLREAQAQAREEKARIERESKEEMAKLIVLGVEKTLSGQK